MKTDLFDEFVEAEAALSAENEAHVDGLKARALVKKTSRLMLRRAKSEAVLAEVLPPVLKMGYSYHVISHGDVDALSYLSHVAKAWPLESVLISTWCMAMPDIVWLRQQVECGRIGMVDFVLGEIFPSQYPDEVIAVQQMVDEGMASMKIARNHAKIMTADNPQEGIWLAIESSSNVNTNPRIEQTAIHMSRELHDHYRNFYADVKSIVKKS